MKLALNLRFDAMLKTSGFSTFRYYKAFEELTGLNNDDIIGKRVTEVIPGIEKTRFIEIYGKVALQDKSVKFEQYSEPLKKYYEIIAYSTGYGYFVTIFNDITGRKVAENKLKEKEELFTEITETILDTICITDEHGNIIYASSSHKDFIGRDSADLIEKNALEFVHPDDYDKAKEKLNSLYKNLEPEKLEYRYLHRDGHYIWVETNGNVICDNNGEIKRFIFSSRDITERKKVGQELKNAYDIINSSPVVAFMWVSDREKGWPVRYVSDNVVDTLGYDVDELIYGKLNYADIIHPDDLDRVGLELSEYTSDPDCTRFQHEPYRVITKQGYVKWVDHITNIIRDDNKKVIYYQGIVQDITHCKLAEDDLRRKEKFLDDVFESIQDGISVVDSDFNIIRVNNKIKEWHADHLPIEGKKCYHVYQNRQYPCNFCPTKRAFINGTKEYEIIDVFADSGYKKLEIFSHPVIDSETNEISSVVEFVRDVTEKIKIENDLVKSKNMLQDIIQNIPVGICITNENGYFYSVNPAYCEIYGYDSSELLGKHFTLVVPEDYRKGLKDLHDSFIEGNEELSGEWPVIDKDGNQKTILSNATKVLGYEGEPKKVTFVSDITKHKEIECKLQDYADELERLNETREIFTDILRHDLLNPISVIIGFTNYLYKNENDEMKIHLLEKILSNNKKAMELIENAGNLAKIECMGDIEFSYLDISDIIGYTLENLTSATNEKEIKIKFLNQDSCYNSYMNPIIEQAFTNLINNSIKYSPQGSEILVDILDDSDYWRIRVKDSGPGIPDEDKQFIFDRFKRGENKRVLGKGLGLAIVKKIVEIHDGVVGVDDNPDGRGSLFWIKLKKA